MSDHRAYYRDRRVAITGGLGFIGSNLARELVSHGARVLLVDSLFPEYGGNRFNINGIESSVELRIADIREQETLDALVADRDIIFNLAGQLSHVDSMTDPRTDLEINCVAQLALLETCRRRNPDVKVVFAGTRQIYGRARSLPVAEDHPVQPTDVNGINKAAGEAYHLLYHQVYGLRTCSLRLTNVFGPRQLLKHNRQGFIGWFVRLALENKEIQVFGDGRQIRDFVYVEDAVDAFLRAGASSACDGQALNVGGPEPINHKSLVEVLVDTAGSGRWRTVEWPSERKAIDIGDFYTDSTKIKTVLGWVPQTSLRDGLMRTFDYYRGCLDKYVSLAPQGA